MTALPEVYAQRTFDFVATMITSSQHIEFYLHWSKCLLNIHGSKDNAFKHHTLLSIQDSITRKYELLNKICDFNKYTLQVLMETVDIKEENGMDENQIKDEESEEEDIDDYILLKSNRNNRNVPNNHDSTSEESD